MISLPATDQAPNLLEFIVQQQDLIARQQEQITQQQEQIVQFQEREIQLLTQIEVLENEIIRLKKLNPKPNVKPNAKPPDDDDPSGSPPCSDGNSDAVDSENDDSYSRKSEVEKPDDTTRRQRSQPASPPVTEEHCLFPEDIPEGSVRHGRESFTVQELEIKAKSVRYWLEQWLTPEGKTISGRPPDSLHGHHFGPQLQGFALLQHYGCAVTQPQLLELLWDAGVSISAGELSNLLTKGHDDFHIEKDELLATGIRCSHYLQTDDTGARHKGQNGFCTVIVNDLFTWFGTTGSKSRENFLTLLLRPWPVYVLNRHGLDYLEKHDLSKKWLRLLEQYNEVHFLNPKAWEDFLNDISFKDRPRLRQSISEGMLYGSSMLHSFDRHMVIFSDGARQFDVFDHAQCWLHAARPLEKVIPVNEQQANAQYWCLSWFWDIYRDLKAFKAEPSEEKADLIRQGFDNLVHTQTSCTELQDTLGGLKVIRKELLLVLDDPSLPLHNNFRNSLIITSLFASSQQWSIL